MHEVQSNPAVSNHGYPGYAVIANKKFRDGLPADMRSRLKAALTQATEYGNGIAQRDNELALSAIRNSGMTQVLQLTDQEQILWRKALQPVLKEMEGCTGFATVNSRLGECASRPNYACHQEWSVLHLKFCGMMNSSSNVAGCVRAKIDQYNAAMPIPLKKNGPLIVLFLSALAIGIALRLYQFGSQILIDDEWHAVHQLIQHRPWDILLSFGVADYCIPLTLLYWLEASWFGLSEFGMRWPMLMSGIATLLLFPLYIWRTLGARHAILFAFLLAISPVLVLYSRIARPYSLTVLLVYLAHDAFDLYWNGTTRRPLYGALYGLSAVLAAWMHLVAGPLVVAPFFYQCYSLFRTAPADRSVRLRLLLQLGLPTALCMALLVLPPLIADVSAIAGKSGADSPTLQTIIGALFWWTGTGSTAVTVLTVFLAALGFPTLWRRLSIVRTIALGLLLTLATLLLMRPAWIHNPITFGRYLLPVIPLLLLSVAAGAVRLADLARHASSALSMVLTLTILAFPALAMAAQSPLREIFFYPNSNIADPFFYFDFRPEHNPMPKQFARNAPLSSFWSQLSARAPGSVRIAAAPFYFESYRWQAPLWERICRQPIIPAYLSGLCIEKRWGEVPHDTRFKFRNAVFVSDDTDLALKKIDMISYQKPYIVTKDDGTKISIGDDTRQCESALRERFGTPTFEDDKVVIFAVRNNRKQNNDQ